MKYNDRADVEKIGQAGAFFTDTMIEGKPASITRQLAAYYLACKQSDTGISEHHRKDGFWESWITLWMSRNVKPSSICIDGGSNYGYYTFFLANHGCNVIALEANPEIIPFLKKSVELNGCSDRVTILHAAIADESNKTIKLGLLPSSLNSTIVQRADLIGSFEVNTKSLDDVAKEFGEIDFVKLDIEGAELLAWKGMQKLLNNNPHCVVLMEFVKEHYEQGGKLFFAEIAEKCDVAYVDYNGDEQPCGFDFLETDTEEYRMIVIRQKEETEEAPALEENEG
jgi:FkbM family methyltransferase